MRQSNITDTRPIDNQLLLDKFILILTMVNTISKKISVKASAAKPLVTPQSGDKTPGIGPVIRLYAI